MDFFTSQQRAERHSRIVAALFVPAVVITALCVSLPLLFWQPLAFVIGFIATTTLILLGTLYQLNLYRGGGAAVAESVGAIRIPVDTPDFRRRRLLDVVEELALAAGINVPPVFILEDESSINAFAAGFGPRDAVITVTAGALNNLSRDELQAVIGHEFSHILHSDIRLNLRLAALVGGLLLIVTTGLLISRIAMSVQPGRSSRDNSAGIIIAIMLFGIVAAVVGWVGMLVGQILQASVCRQREFLADASSVQYTRNPGALCSALGKIHVLENGSSLDHHQALNVGHMLFASGSGNWWSRIVATHPPVPARLIAIDRNFKIDPSTLSADAAHQRTMSPQTASTQPHALDHATATDLAATQELLARLPPNLRQHGRDPNLAPALAAGLLLSSGADPRAAQLQALRSADPSLHDKTAALIPDLDAAGPGAKLPLAKLVSPALAQLPADQRTALHAPLTAVAQAADNPHASQSLLALLTARTRADAAPPKPQFFALAPLLEDAAVLISALSAAAEGHSPAGQESFHRAAAALGTPDLPIPPHIAPDRLLNAIQKIDLASPPLKTKIANALKTTLPDDASQEAQQTYRSIVAAIHCPLR